ncbi:MAG: hypothetical protein M1831_002265 [Alyxoria varia]|nr:MAG: hypothetical protein M1831_002265 [Alyxoria varia]
MGLPLHNPGNNPTRSSRAAAETTPLGWYPLGPKIPETPASNVPRNDYDPKQNYFYQLRQSCPKSDKGQPPGPPRSEVRLANARRLNDSNTGRTPQTLRREGTSTARGAPPDSTKSSAKPEQETLLHCPTQPTRTPTNTSRGEGTGKEHPRPLDPHVHFRSQPAAVSDYPKPNELLRRKGASTSYGTPLRECASNVWEGHVRPRAKCSLADDSWDSARANGGLVRGSSGFGDGMDRSVCIVNCNDGASTRKTPEDSPNVNAFNTCASNCSTAEVIKAVNALLDEEEDDATLVEGAAPREGEAESAGSANIDHISSWLHEVVTVGSEDDREWEHAGTGSSKAGLEGDDGESEWDSCTLSSEG